MFLVEKDGHKVYINLFLFFRSLLFRFIMQDIHNCSPPDIYCIILYFFILSEYFESVKMNIVEILIKKAMQ